jgi:hypothetical protein
MAAQGVARCSADREAFFRMRDSEDGRATLVSTINLAQVVVGRVVVSGERLQRVYKRQYLELQDK